MFANHAQLPPAQRAIAQKLDDIVAKNVPGVELKPEPPVIGVKENRRVVHRSPDEVDEAQLVSWVKQAAALPGWLA